MSEQQSSGDKTEKATAKRVEDASKKGYYYQVA
jgi:flagellar biosynthesis protein FlhB